MPNSNISMVVTSCGRHDLLKETLDSFYQFTDIEPQQLIIVEDSDLPMPEFLTDFVWRQRNLTWLSNEGRMGQIYSADRGMKEVKHDYVFWAEDDWQFTKNSNWMARSKEILNEHPSIVQVSLRGDSGWHELESSSYGFKIAKPYWRGTWGGWSFNCGLRRASIYKELGSFGKHVAYGTHGLGHEAELSKLLLDKGYRIADLGEEIVVHTGGSRSRAIEPLSPLPRVLVAIPVCHKYDYGKWESENSPHFNQGKAWRGQPYGTDIHISFNDENRVSALRDTWLKDVKTFSGHVDYKLFYGVPHNRPPLEDEVFLSCPDDYEHLPEKTIEICKYALEHGYEWVFKADDDSYVWVDRLVSELIERRCGMDYGGYLNGNICSGGTGYWLNRRAMRVVAAFKPSHWAEDVTVGQALKFAGMEPTMLSNHHPGFSEHWYDINKIPENAVCIHAVKPTDMRTLYGREHALGK